MLASSTAFRFRLKENDFILKHKTYDKSMFYDSIEEYGVEEVLERYSLSTRDRMLALTPDEDLVMYSIIGLYPEEMRQLFSRKALQKEFSRLLPTDLFYSYDMVKEFLPQKVVRELFLELPTREFVEEYKKTPDTVFEMLDLQWIQVSDIVEKLRHLPVETIRDLTRYHRRFLVVWNGLKELLEYCILPLRSSRSARQAYTRDIAKVIVAFI